MKSWKWVVGVGALLSIFGAYDHYGDLMREDPKRYDWRFWFPKETGVRQLARLQKDERVYLPDLLEEHWDTACFLEDGDIFRDNDPRITELGIPTEFDQSVHMVILRRGSTYDAHLFYRNEVWQYVHHGLADDEACYDTTALNIEYKDHDWISVGPRRLHIWP